MKPNRPLGLVAITAASLFLGACAAPETPSRAEQASDRITNPRGEDSLLGDMLSLEDRITGLSSELDEARRELRTERSAKVQLESALEAERQRRAVAEEDAERHGAIRDDLESRILALRIHATELEGELLKMRIREETRSVAAPIGGR